MCYLLLSTCPDLFESGKRIVGDTDQRKPVVRLEFEARPGKENVTDDEKKETDSGRHDEG